MGRNELYITVPKLFRCPISLDVMKSPVSLTTGVTYDRSSIQHWLDSGHDTCPATMQVLSSKDFIPNLTLHRIINLWHHSSHLTPSPPPPPAPSEKQVGVWIEDIKSQNLGSMIKIVDFLNYSDENKRFLAGFDYFIEELILILSKSIGELDIKYLELIVRVLDLILVQNVAKENLQKLTNKNCLNSLLFVLKTGNSTSNDAVLSLLISLASTTRSVKSQLIQLKLVEIISKILSSQNAAVSSISEKSLKLLSIVSTSAEGRLAIREDEKCVGCIVERLMKVSKTATEHGLTVLWSMCCVYKDEKVTEKAVTVKGLTKILLVMQSDQCDGHVVRRMCVDLVKVLRVDSGGVMRYETKTTHIMPC